jgi:putative membrane protein
MVKRIETRIISVIITVSLLVAAVPSAALAGPPRPTVDEAVYVNLDYYGKPKNINIVKSVSMNGNKTLTDFGSYKKVTNMSDETRPALKSDSVKWNFDEDPGRVYLECTPKNNTMNLPWTIDISYKLNGIPVEAKKLAGVAGMIETNIDIVPNNNVSDYYKNNMLLQVVTAVDMSEVKSLEAPGSQLQSVGQSKIVIFAALPGEKTTFTMRVGTKRYKTSGLLISMVPGTLEQLKDIKQIKEDKDTFQDSFNSIHDSTNDMLETVNSMSTSLIKMQAGLSSLKSANNTINSSKKGLYDKSDKALADMSALTAQMSEVTPYLTVAQQAIRDTNADLNTINRTISDSKSDLTALNNSIGMTQNDINELRGNLENINEHSDDARSSINKTKDDISRARDNIASLSQSATVLNSSLAELRTSISTLEAALQYVSSSTDTAEIPPVDAVDQAVLAALQSMNNQQKQLIAQTIPTLQSTENMLAVSVATTSGLAEICRQSGAYLDTASTSVSLVESYLDDMDDLNGDAQHSLKNLNETLSITKNTLTTGETLIDNYNALNSTMNRYKDSSINALKETEKLSKRMTASLTSTKEFLETFQAMLKASDKDIENGANQSLSGMIDTLSKSLKGISKTPGIRRSNDTIKKTADKEFDKFENENKFLSLDAEAKPISFTSPKNPTPSSIQIVMRTEEIDPDNNNKTAINEKGEQKVNVFARLVNVFKKTWQLALSIF